MGDHPTDRSASHVPNQSCETCDPVEMPPHHPTSSPGLFKVIITHWAYVFADNEDEAACFGDEIVAEESRYDVDVERVTHRSERLGGWEDGCLVYWRGSGDKTLGDLWPKPPPLPPAPPASVISSKGLPHDKYAGQAAHEAAGWKPNDDPKPPPRLRSLQTPGVRVGLSSYCTLFKVQGPVLRRGVTVASSGVMPIIVLWDGEDSAENVHPDNLVRHDRAYEDMIRRIRMAKAFRNAGNHGASKRFAKEALRLRAWWMGNGNG